MYRELAQEEGQTLATPIKLDIPVINFPIYGGHGEPHSLPMVSTTTFSPRLSMRSETLPRAAAPYNSLNNMTAYITQTDKI